MESPPFILIDRLKINPFALQQTAAKVMPIMMALGWMAFGDLWSGSMRRQQPNSIIIPYEERHFSLSLCVCVLCCVELCDGGSVDIIILVYSSAKFFLSFFFLSRRLALLGHWLGAQQRGQRTKPNTHPYFPLACAFSTNKF